MLRQIVKPGNVVKLLAGLSHMFFERMKGNGHVNGHAEEGRTETAVIPDDFTLINGIGPTFANRLQSAGICTFADLAESTPAQIREAANVAEWQADPAEWIAQAKGKL